MITIATIRKAAAQKESAVFEINHNAEVDYISDAMMTTTQVGFSHNGNVYHWFDVTVYNGEEVTDTTPLSFLETYSRNTGVSKRGTMHGIDVQIGIEELAAKYDKEAAALQSQAAVIKADIAARAEVLHNVEWQTVGNEQTGTVEFALITSVIDGDDTGAFLRDALMDGAAWVDSQCELMTRETWTRYNQGHGIYINGLERSLVEGEKVINSIKSSLKFATDLEDKAATKAAFAELQQAAINEMVNDVNTCKEMFVMQSDRVQQLAVMFDIVYSNGRQRGKELQRQHMIDEIAKINLK